MKGTCAWAIEMYTPIHYIYSPRSRGPNGFIISWKRSAGFKGVWTNLNRATAACREELQRIKKKWITILRSVGHEHLPWNHAVMSARNGQWRKQAGKEWRKGWAVHSCSLPAPPPQPHAKRKLELNIGYSRKRTSSKTRSYWNNKGTGMSDCGKDKALLCSVRGKHGLQRNYSSVSLSHSLNNHRNQRWKRPLSSLTA